VASPERPSPLPGPMNEVRPSNQLTPSPTVSYKVIMERERERERVLLGGRQPAIGPQIDGRPTPNSYLKGLGYGSYCGGSLSSVVSRIHPSTSFLFAGSNKTNVSVGHHINALQNNHPGRLPSPPPSARCHVLFSYWRAASETKVAWSL
jgi:hypothetical protein